MMHTILARTLFTFLCFSSFLISTILSAQDHSDLPRLRGEYVTAYGHFGGYLPPQVGDSIYVDFNKLLKQEGMGMLASFGAKGPSYVPLLGSLKQETDVSVSGRGLRLTSSGEGDNIGDHSVTIDILLFGSRAEVWIVASSPLIHSVALLHCEILPDSVEIDGRDEVFHPRPVVVEETVKSDLTTINQIQSIVQELQSEANSMQILGRGLTSEELNRVDQLLEVVGHLEKATARLAEDE